MTEEMEKQTEKRIIEASGRLLAENGPWHQLADKMMRDLKKYQSATD